MNDRVDNNAWAWNHDHATRAKREDNTGSVQSSKICPLKNSLHNPLGPDVIIRCNAGCRGVYLEEALVLEWEEWTVLSEVDLQMEGGIVV